MARPKEDAPEKYEKASRIYELRHPVQSGPAHSRVEQIERLLSWAMRQELEGFQEGEVIGISAAAMALKTSRSTVAQAVERLVRRGQLQEQPKAPYRIVSRRPLLPDPRELASAPISVTRQLHDQEGGSWVFPLASPQPESLRPLLARSLFQSSDQAIRDKLEECRLTWEERALSLFSRVRYTLAQRPLLWLWELTWLALPAELEESLSLHVATTLEEGIRHVSLSHMLKLAGVSGLVNGRTRVTLGSLSQEVRDYFTVQIQAYCDMAPVGLLERGGSAKGLLRCLPQKQPLFLWEYGHFATEPSGLISFSLCFVDPEAVHLYIRELDLVIPGELPKEEVG